jgi:hypothetical protein
VLRLVRLEELRVALIALQLRAVERCLREVQPRALRRLAPARLALALPRLHERPLQLAELELLIARERLRRE